MNLQNRISTSIVLFIFFFSLYIFTMSGRVQYGDDTEKYRVAQSIVERGKLSFRPTQDHGWRGPDGENYSVYELGQSVLEIPLYVIGRAAHQFFPAPDINHVPLLFVGLLNPLLTALTCVLLFETGLLVGFRRRTSMGLSLLFGLATIAFPYSKGYTREPSLAFLILLSVYFVLRFERTRQNRWLFVAACAAGYLIFTKFIHAVVFPILLFYIAIIIYQLSRQRGDDRKKMTLAIGTGILWFLSPALLLVIIQSLSSTARFGVPYAGFVGNVNNPIDQIGRFLGESTPLQAIIGLTISPEKSVFLYSPPVLLFPIAWFLWFKRDRNTSLLILTLLVVEFASAIFRLGWHGGDWWGPRYLVQTTPLLILSLGALEGVSSRRARPALLVLGLLGLAVQLVGVLTNERDYLDIRAVGPYLFGQIDYLLHGAIDSLFIYLSPANPLPSLNSFGLFLLVCVVTASALLASRLRTQPDARSSRSVGMALVLIVLFLQFTAFLAFVVAPYAGVLAARGDTRYFAANRFDQDGRKPEAAAMYIWALENGTHYQSQAAARLQELLEFQPGDVFSPTDLMVFVEKPAEAVIIEDTGTSLFGKGSLKISIPPGQDGVARATSDGLNVQPGTAFEISGWIKTESVYGTGQGVVTLYEDNGKWENKSFTDLAKLDETGGWRPFSKTITTLPTTRRIFLGAGLWKTFGTLFVEDIRIAELPAK